MNTKRKKASEEIRLGKDIQYWGRIILAVGAVVAVIGNAIEREGESKSS